MNGFNLSDIQDARLGGTQLSAIYLGSTKLWPQIDYSQEYLTIESLENSNNIQFVAGSSATTLTIQWSTDKITWYSSTSSTSPTVITTLNNGDIIYLKGTNSAYASSRSNVNYANRLLSTKNINVYGNIMSLIYGDNFINQTTLSTANIFYSLFNGSKIVDASNLVLPALTLSVACYEEMFRGVTTLLYVPKVLPALTLTSRCYFNMFLECSSLTEVPYDMLPATTLAAYCYQGLYARTPLVDAPLLPATTLAPYCYQSLFQQCSSLKTITCLATDISANRCIFYWVYLVGNTGTFRKKSGVTYDTGISGIPSGWTVVDV